MEKIKSKIAEILISYPKSMLICLGIVSLFAIYPASSIKTNFNLEEFFPKEDPTLISYQNVAELFGRDDTIFILSLESDSLTASQLLEIKSIQEVLNTHYTVNKVRSVWDLEQLSVINNEINSSFYLDSLANPNQLKALQESELIKNTFVNKEQTFSVLFIDIQQKYNIYTYRKELIAFILFHHWYPILQNTIC